MANHLQVLRLDEQLLLPGTSQARWPTSSERPNSMAFSRCWCAASMPSRHTRLRAASTAVPAGPASPVNPAFGASRLCSRQICLRTLRKDTLRPRLVQPPGRASGHGRLGHRRRLRSHHVDVLAVVRCGALRMPSSRSSTFHVSPCAGTSATATLGRTVSPSACVRTARDPERASGAEPSTAARSTAPDLRSARRSGASPITCHSVHVAHQRGQPPLDAAGLPARTCGQTPRADGAGW